MAQAQATLPSATPQPTPSFSSPTALPNPPSASSTLTSKSEHLMHKNRLQEYAQRLALPLPAYSTVNEGLMHKPLFRSFVLVDGQQFTSPNTFSNIKAAEQDVAKAALESIVPKIRDEAYQFIREDTLFCKSILNEYASKINFPIPGYTTIQTRPSIPTFVSSLVFNGQTYVGDVGKTKKEAEQLAARAVILSLMDNSDSSRVLCEIVKAKLKFVAALNEVKELNTAQCSTAPSGTDSAPPSMSFVNPSKENETPSLSNNLPMTVLQHGNVFKRPRVKESCEVIDLPLSFVHASLGQFEVGFSSSKKKKKKKRKANKRVQSVNQLLNSPVVQQVGNLPAIDLIQDQS